MKLDELVKTQMETEINIRVDGRNYRVKNINTLNTIIMSISKRLKQLVVDTYHDNFDYDCMTSKYLQERCA